MNNNGYDLREIPLKSAYFRKEAKVFLSGQSLEMADLDYMAGIYDSDDVLQACGGLDGNVIKCVAVNPASRGLNLAEKIVSHLCDKAMRDGYGNITVFTKPQNRDIFSGIGFSYVGGCDQAIMMELDRTALQTYIGHLASLRKDGINGVIVMNANPFTLGHKHLIEQASLQVDNLYIIPLADNVATMFSHSSRREMICRATAPLRNVTVTESSNYAISRATFPTYFIKEITDATEAHIALDLDIFASKIAPALSISKRFVGTEPTDALTALYNRRMSEILPAKGIKVIEIPRIEANSAPISASTVRRLITTGKAQCAFCLVPETSLPYVIGEAAAQALICELDTTPKPGLVDKNDSGAHRDMDYALMRRSIDSIRPYFISIAKDCFTSRFPDPEALSETGIQAERAMLTHTGGVNTHRGAIFSLGLAVAASSHLLASYDTVSDTELQKTISRIAKSLRQPQSTHGAQAKKRFGIPGALDHAQAGYPALFNLWLPFLRRTANDETANLKLLLKIMSVLEDSNIYFRKGKETAIEIKATAAATLEKFSVAQLSELNRDFIIRNISPGGAADMLALTLFISSIIKTP